MKENVKVFLNKVFLYVKEFLVYLVLFYTTVSYVILVLLAYGFDIEYKGLDKILHEYDVQVYQESVVE